MDARESGRDVTKNERITISFSSGLELSFSPTTVQGLENAQPTDLAEIEISPSGFGLYFPKVDTDLYIPSLLHGLLGTEKCVSLNKRHKSFIGF